MHHFENSWLDKATHVMPRKICQQRRIIFFGDAFHKLNVEMS